MGRFRAGLALRARDSSSPLGRSTSRCAPRPRLRTGTLGTGPARGLGATGTRTWCVTWRLTSPACGNRPERDLPREPATTQYVRVFPRPALCVESDRSLGPSASRSRHRRVLGERGRGKHRVVPGLRSDGSDLRLRRGALERGTWPAAMPGGEDHSFNDSTLAGRSLQLSASISRLMKKSLPRVTRVCNVSAPLGREVVGGSPGAAPQRGGARWSGGCSVKIKVRRGRD